MFITIFLVIVLSLIAAWLTWNYANRIFEKKLVTYTKVISEFENQNKEITRQLNITKQQIQASSESEIVKSVEKRNKDLVEQHHKVINVVSTIRNKVESDYPHHGVTEFVLKELDKIVPSDKTIDSNKEKGAKDVFNRIKQRLDASKESTKEVKPNVGGKR